jgi:hypothetical protein
MEFNIGKGIEFAWKKKAQIQQILWDKIFYRNYSMSYDKLQ